MGGSTRFGLVLAASILFAMPAHAEPSSQDRATAQSFFDKAIALMKDSKFKDACPLLEESQRLDPGVGTQFQLAKCFEGEGRVATAWVQYLDVADASKAANNAERERVARQHASAVAPRVPHLTVAVAAANGEIEVKRDGEALRKVQWGMPVPVDPGKHTVVAKAAGKKSWEGSIDVKEGQEAQIAVPELGPDNGVPPPVVATAPPPASASPATSSAPAPTSPPPSAPANDGGGSTQKTVGIVVGAVGVVALGVGVALGFAAKSKYGDTGNNCIDSRCNDAGYATRTSAVKTGTTGTIIGAIGLVAIAGGATLWLIAPKGETTTGLGITPTLGGLSLRGGF